MRHSLFINRSTHALMRSIFLRTALKTAITTAIALSLAACGGGGGGSGSSDVVSNAASNPPVNTPTTTTATSSTVGTATTPTDGTPAAPVGVNTPTTPAVSVTETTTPLTAAPTYPTPVIVASGQQAALQLLSDNRQSCGFGALRTNPNLTVSAANHANYLAWLSQSNRQPIAAHHESVLTDTQGNTLANSGITNPYFSGNDVNTRLNPTTLGARANPTRYDAYRGVVGESLAMANFGTTGGYPSLDSAANAKDMLIGLLAAPYHARSMVLPVFNEVGVSYAEVQWSRPEPQIDNRTYYYTQSILELVLSLPAHATPTVNNSVLSYPCEGSVTAYELTHEDPNPFGNTRDLAQRPIGQPIYILAPEGKTVQTASGSISQNGQNVGFMHVLTKANDPNQLLNANEVILMPDTPLQPDTAYQVRYDLTLNDGERVSKAFNLRTKTKS